MFKSDVASNVRLQLKIYTKQLRLIPYAHLSNPLKGIRELSRRSVGFRIEVRAGKLPYLIITTYPLQVDLNML